MSENKYLVDTNVLIYHTKDSQVCVDFINGLIEQRAFNINKDRVPWVG